MFRNGCISAGTFLSVSVISNGDNVDKNAPNVMLVKCFYCLGLIESTRF